MCVAAFTIACGSGWFVVDDQVTHRSWLLRGEEGLWDLVCEELVEVVRGPLLPELVELVREEEGLSAQVGVGVSLSAVSLPLPWALAWT